MCHYHSEEARYILDSTKRVLSLHSTRSIAPHTPFEMVALLMTIGHNSQTKNLKYANDFGTLSNLGAAPLDIMSS